VIEIFFEKYEQAGNDFVIIDARSLSLPEGLSLWVRRVCDRHKGVGADGLLLLLDSQVADYRVRIFNADGSEPAMCGNGVSCLLTFLFSRPLHKTAYTLEMMNTLVFGEKQEEKVSLSLGKVQVLHFPILIPDLGTWYVVNTGVPHAVFFLKEGQEIDVEKEGRKVRGHPLFAPDGVNVNFARVLNDSIEVRTYERGVEKETLSCGTGGAAVAFVAQKLYNIKGWISIANRVDFCSDPIVYIKQNAFLFDEKEGKMYMLSQARQVFKGAMFL